MIPYKMLAIAELFRVRRSFALPLTILNPLTHFAILMDRSAISVAVFDNLAERYKEKYMDLTLYDESYREFCQLIRPGRASVLEAACGPGNVSRFLMAQRPELDLLGIDLAPRMVDLARAAVPSARFAIHDCRRLADLQMRFDGIICAFGLPYLSQQETKDFLHTIAQALEPDGVLYLSTMLGANEESGFETEDCSSGDQVYVNYHNEGQIMSLLEDLRFTVIKRRRIPSPSTAPKATTDLIVIARI